MVYNDTRTHSHTLFLMRHAIDLTILLNFRHSCFCKMKLFATLLAVK